jgi:hypothetical protein
LALNSSSNACTLYLYTFNRIEIEGGKEIPVLDNSALGWVLSIQQVRRVAVMPGHAAAAWRTSLPCYTPTPTHTHPPTQTKPTQTPFKKQQAGVRDAPLEDASSSGSSSGGGAEDGEEELQGQRLVLVPNETITVQKGDAFVTFYPGACVGVSGCGVYCSTRMWVVSESRGMAREIERDLSRAHRVTIVTHRHPRHSTHPPPGNFQKVTGGVDVQDDCSIIGQQWYSWRAGLDYHFRCGWLRLRWLRDSWLRGREVGRGRASVWW